MTQGVRGIDAELMGERRGRKGEDEDDKGSQGHNREFLYKRGASANGRTKRQIDEETYRGKRGEAECGERLQRA